MKSVATFLANALPIFAVASFTLGLMPFTPEPHIWEKIRWIATGQMPSESIYWLDLLMHGSPWLLLILSIAAKLSLRKKHADA